MTRRSILLALGLAAFWSPVPGPRSLAAQGAAPGKAVYDKWCAGCHGDTGAGDGVGAAYMLPRPRDFTKGVYQIRTTASGEIPDRADLRRIVDDGMPGTAMPGWRERLTERERDEVVAYLESFSRFFQGERPPAIDPGDAPGGASVEAGREAYRKLECFKCHGEMGRGDGPSAPTLTDDWDHPIRAADLSESWHFTGGSSVGEIYVRLRTGLDGTPMPSFADAVDAGLISDEQLWSVARYVRSLSPEEPPEVREVVRAGRVEGSLPASPDDSAWRAAEAHYVPLVGQIVVKPRWFTPTVDGIWVQALHDGERLALLLRWHDPSRSPDASWDEWLDRMRRTVTDADGALAGPQGPDLVVVQLPTTLGESDELPYFLGGSTRRAAHLWRWASDADRAVEGTATGLDRFVPRAAGQELTSVSRWSDGEWRVQLTRPLRSADTTAAPSIPIGRAIPIAFRASDGSSGEGDVRTAVSAWYAIHLEVPTPPRVYATPVATMLLTAALGVLVVRRAQRRERDSERPIKEET
jgi:DMSO reductase family type II enzyme heme b subunit